MITTAPLRPANLGHNRARTSRFALSAATLNACRIFREE